MRGGKGLYDKIREAVKRVSTAALVFALFFCNTAFAQSMNDYCQFPVSAYTPVEPNVLFLVDTSGSMGWKAYSYNDTDADGDGYLDGYNPNVTYEGYFDPAKHYKEQDGIYTETIPTGNPCVKTCTVWKCRTFNLGDCVWNAHGCSNRWACCTSWQTSGDCDIYSGNYLNYAYMTRIDLLRWALTGGRPESCNNSIRSCDPEVYPDPQLSCDTEGCVLLTNSGIKVKARWERITGSKGGLLFQLKSLSPRPLIGAMFFDGSGVTRTVYIGDFTASANFDGVNPYKNVITAINFEPPGGATPTAPALWDAYNYFAQSTPRYGGPQPQTGSGNEWKNPMYRCFDRNNDGNCQGNEFELVHCAKNFIVLLTDGQWNTGGLPVTTSCRIDGDVEAESPDPVVPAYWLHKKGFVNQATNISSYVESIYTVGLWLGGTGELALKNIAMYGSFDRSRQWPGGTTGYPQGSCGPVDDCCHYSGCGKGSPCTPLPSSSTDWDKNGDGLPDTFYKADDAVQIKERLVDVMLDILRHASSGTAASVLGSSEGSGANLFQAIFYPRRAFEREEVDWTGELHALWYYVDPNLQNLNIREDTDENYRLDLKDDRVIQFFFDQGEGEVKVKKYSDADGDGSPDTLCGMFKLDDVRSLFRVGYLLWKRDLSASPRTLYTSSGTSLIEFSPSNAGSLQAALGVATVDEARAIIEYVHGYDISGLRERSATLGGETHVWKLGDIVSSTPKLLSQLPLNSYHLSTPAGYADSSYYDYINAEGYKNRGMVFFGANDGMLHAVKIGRLEFSWDGKGSYEIARISGEEIGKEAWAFIPRHALPYLRYLSDPLYCHLSYVDLTPYIFDASINGGDKDTKTMSSWRTILIGGMGLGGASRDHGSSCSDCVKAPLPGIGFSSYFALDVTDPENPTLLWEFADPDLGFSTSGPAVVRIGHPLKNGRWFVVFGSGPTGPIDRNYKQFLGRSDQSLKLFVLDLKTGTLLRKIDTGIPNAFSGSLFNATLDCEKGAGLVSGSYSDDVLYVGYTKWDGGWKGGVLRLVTRDDEDPSNWTVSKVIEGIGPVTSGVTKLVNRRDAILWLYFGTGRFFYRSEAGIDDSDSRQAIYGVKEPCYTLSNDLDGSCTQPLSPLLLTDSTVSPPSSAPAYGWFISLDPPSGTRKAERIITDPLAVFSGVVFFPSFSPSSDVCSLGGSTQIWAVRYDTGGVPGSAAMKGKALLQVSTGQIKEVELATGFTDKGGRRTEAITGMPPKGQALAVIYPPGPMKKVIHMKER